MSSDADGAIQVLQDGLEMEKKNRFKQADSLVIPSHPLHLESWFTVSAAGFRAGMDVVESTEVPGIGRHVPEDD